MLAAPSLACSTVALMSSALAVFRGSRCQHTLRRLADYLWLACATDRSQRDIEKGPNRSTRPEPDAAIRCYLAPHSRYADQPILQPNSRQTDSVDYGG
jgi:hypothetical protein